MEMLDDYSDKRQLLSMKSDKMDAAKKRFQMRVASIENQHQNRRNQMEELKQDDREAQQQQDKKRIQIMKGKFDQFSNSSYSDSGYAKEFDENSFNVADDEANEFQRVPEQYKRMLQQHRRSSEQQDNRPRMADYFEECTEE